MSVAAQRIGERPCVNVHETLFIHISFTKVLSIPAHSTKCSGVSFIKVASQSRHPIRTPYRAFGYIHRIFRSLGPLRTHIQPSSRGSRPQLSHISHECKG